MTSSILRVVFQSKLFIIINLLINLTNGKSFGERIDAKNQYRILGARMRGLRRAHPPR
jgi:hypothetical protein